MAAYKIIVFDRNEDLREILSNSTLELSYAKSVEDLYSDQKYSIAIINPDLCSENIREIVKSLLSRKIPTLAILERYEEVEKTIDALSAGAIDYFQKPVKGVTPKAQLDLASKEITAKIELAIESKEKIMLMDTIKFETSDFDFSESSRKIIVIASSTGGPQSLEQVIPMIPKEIPGAVVVVQHMPPVFTQKLAERLNSLSELHVKEAEDKEEVAQGVCYIAKGDFHLELKKGHNNKIMISLNKKERMLGVRPCANITMESAARIYGKNAVGVVLTGMGQDGTIGAKKIKKSGGTIIVQSESTSIIYGMPKSVVQSGYYDEIVDIQKIPVAILQVMEV